MNNYYLFINFGSFDIGQVAEFWEQHILIEVDSISPQSLLYQFITGYIFHYNQFHIVPLLNYESYLLHLFSLILNQKHFVIMCKTMLNFLPCSLIFYSTYLILFIVFGLICPNCNNALVLKYRKEFSVFLGYPLTHQQWDP